LNDQRRETSGGLKPGQTLGSYRIESVLGVGGMGHVYRATAPDGEEVALKLVKTDLAQDTVFRKRFEREARIAQTVAHEHVVPVLDTGEQEGIPYLTQKFIRGGSLAEMIEQDGKVSLEIATRVCREAASGLDALHAQGLIHRDVKPANILLDAQGITYITDFGLAKDTQGSLLTRPGQALGSMDYMAPEQIRGEEVTAATDVYGLACVVWECLLGKPPFADRQGMRVLWAHLQDDPPDPATLSGDVPPAVGQVILRALGKDPAARPQSASKFAHELEQAVMASS
jgi:serine/threonine protein kinase